jgi:uncharacterized oxidoreductase
MKTTNNTVLITGGTAGIGFEIASKLSENGNRVIITGRDKSRLNNALARLKNTTGFTLPTLLLAAKRKGKKLQVVLTDH